MECWRRRRNKEIRELIGVPTITNSVKARIIKWFGHVMRWPDAENLKAALDGNLRDQLGRQTKGATDRSNKAGLGDNELGRKSARSREEL